MKIYKIVSASKHFMEKFNSYYDYFYQEGESVLENDYGNLKAEVRHFNIHVAHGTAIEIVKK
ncbi:hypothetical protein [Leuconostoc mesenteroides]|uniref:hypothetical protein n=1 Tax=Leuconostoc mesenteroides TaxID=1245 RepID=UPI00107F3C71|nr:hypothetical protein [Leuconostoc mesenteroides]TGD34945.1 hypothetical protein EIA53_05335 [Leuconostoc mesenteroides]